MKCDFDDLYNGSVMRPYYLNEERVFAFVPPLRPFWALCRISFQLWDQFRNNFGNSCGDSCGVNYGVNFEVNFENNLQTVVRQSSCFSSGSHKTVKFVTHCADYRTERQDTLILFAFEVKFHWGLFWLFLRFFRIFKWNSKNISFKLLDSNPSNARI